MKLWEVPSGRAIHGFAGYDEIVTEIAVTPDFRLALSAGNDRDRRTPLKLWDIASGRLLREFGDTDGAHCASLSADGRLALSGSGSTLTLWDRGWAVVVLASCPGTRPGTGPALCAQRSQITAESGESRGRERRHGGCERPSQRRGRANAGNRAGERRSRRDPFLTEDFSPMRAGYCSRIGFSSSCRVLGGLAFAAALVACGGTDGRDAAAGAGSGAQGDTLSATIGPQGGELTGQVGSALEGVHVSIPPHALTADTTISVVRADSGKALPSTAFGCGPQFFLEPAGLKLATPATITLPFSEDTVTSQDRFDDQVKIWALQGDTWGQRLQTDSSTGLVTFQTDTLDIVQAGVNPPAQTDVVKFDLHPNPKFLSCLAAYPNDPTRAPAVHVEVVRGTLNDGLFLRGKNIKPQLAFDLFTVENSSLSADGTPDPSFKNFGLAWYQSDLEADDDGSMRVSIRTILLDQIFGFDPNVNLPPTSTFEVGFWFNNPQDAVACGFDATKPTPFNGEHQAGPLAMITVPDATTGLGPLCTKPDTSVTPARCSP
jgi:hypothetical protein